MTLSLSRFGGNRRCLIAVFLLISGLLVSTLFSLQSVGRVELSDYNSYSCSTGSDSTESFDILTLTPRGVFELADALCHSQSFGALFGEVTIAWHARKFLNASHIVDEAYDYFWNREHVVEGLVPAWEDYYTPVLETPRYPLYWFSRFKEPRLTRAFFSDKRVGFLQDTRSQTFFLQPVTALKEAGITLRDDQKHFYRDITELNAAFRRGDIDVMTGFLSLGDPDSPGTDFYTLRFDDAVPSGKWYLRKVWLLPEIVCPLISADISMPMFHQAATKLVAMDCGL